MNITESLDSLIQTSEVSEVLNKQKGKIVYYDDSFKILLN